LRYYTSMKTFLALLLVVCGILGIFDAGYLTYNEFSGQVPPCRPPFACDTVLKSVWSHIGPIPLSVFGLIFYATIFLLGVLAVLEVKKLTIGKREIYLPFITALLGIFGAGFSLYLVFIMGVILKAWCLYCLFSATNSVIICLLSTSFFWVSRSKQFESLSTRSQRAARMDT